MTSFPPGADAAEPMLASLGLRSWGEDGAVSERWRGVWRALLAGEPAQGAAVAEDLEREALTARDAGGVVEAAALRALGASLTGDLDDATRMARRASRMARTEALPEAEYLANVVLARVRRLTGRPHLAARILGALARVAPSSWTPWVRWESLLATPGAEPETPEADGFFPIRALQSFLAGARSGDAPVVAEAGAHLRTLAAASPLLGFDLEPIVDVSDLTRPPRSDEVRAWRQGTTDAIPAALHGMLTLAGDAPAEHTVMAYVLGRPATAPLRVPRLLFGPASAGDVVVLPQGHRRQGRNETMVSALVCAGDEGLGKGELFAATYGFEFDPPLHENVLQVAIHRARQWLGDAGVIRAESERLTLEVHRPVLVPDPRCAESLEDRLLRTVARSVGLGAADIARVLGLSERVVQRALRTLAEEGLCTAHKEGRKVVYAVEDTTFREPTRAD